MNRLVYLVISIIIFLIILYLFVISQHSQMESMSNAIPQQKFVMRIRPNHNNPIINFTQFNNNSDMFIALHNQQYNLFKVGVPATPGLVSLVETGHPDELVDELLTEPDNYINYYVGAPNQNEYNIYTTANFLYMSFVTMIKPSSVTNTYNNNVDDINIGYPSNFNKSDWFMGIDTLDIMNIEHSRILPVFAYDAGIVTSSNVSRFDDQLIKPVSYVNTKESNQQIMFTLNKKPPIPPVAYIEIMRVPDLDIDTINNRDVII